MATKKTIPMTVMFDSEHSLRTIGKAVEKIFTTAQSDRNSSNEHFEKSLSEVLKDCHNARRGLIGADEKVIADELCHLGLEFEKRKSIQAKDIFADVIRHSIDQPIYEPSNVPELPASAEKQVLQDVYKSLLEEGYTGPLTEGLIKPLKLEALGKYNDEAQKKASLAEKYVRDKLEQMDYDNEMDKVIDDFVSMPYCVANYPYYEYKQVPKWEEDKWTVQNKLVGRMKRVSPFDFYIVGGSEAKKSSAVIEVCRVHPHDLEEMKGKEGWYDDVIDELVSKRAALSTQVVTLNRNPEDKNKIFDRDGIEYVKFYGKLPRELFDGTEVKLDSKKTTYVEMIVYASGDKVLYCRQQKANSAEFRPYFTSAYEKLNGSMAGIAIIQRILKVSKIARAMVYASIRNAAYSAQPTGEIDVARLTEFQKTEDLNELKIGTLLHAAPDLTGKQGGHTPAVTLYSIPNHASQFQAMITYYMDMIDTLSGVPKISSGDMRGNATLGRSFRGIALVQAAESKSTKSALDNFDHDVQEPIFLSMYNELMEDSKNEAVKGDIRVKSRGTSGYTTKEAKAAAKQEALQFLAPFAQEMDPKMKQALLYSVMQDMGVDTERYSGQPATSISQDLNLQTTSPGFGGQQLPV